MNSKLSNLFKVAHKLAKAMKEQFRSYREAFALALRKAWKMIERTNDEAIRSGLKDAAKAGLKAFGRLFLNWKRERVEAKCKAILEAENAAQKARMGKLEPYGRLLVKPGKERVYIRKPVSLLKDFCSACIEYHRTGTYKSIQILGVQYSNSFGAKVIQAVKDSFLDLVSGSFVWSEDVPEDVRKAIEGTVKA